MPLGTSRTEQGSEADALQRPLRSRLRVRLTASAPYLLVWHATGTHRHLPPKVRRAFHAASGAEALI
jgi:hypothetical protein